MVIKHSNDRRKELEEFVTILSKRVDIEETYAKSLEENAKMAEKIKQGEDKSVLHYLVSRSMPSPPSRRTVQIEVRRQGLLPSL